MLREVFAHRRADRRRCHVVAQQRAEARLLVHLRRQHLACAKVRPISHRFAFRQLRTASNASECVMKNPNINKIFPLLQACFHSEHATANHAHKLRGLSWELSKRPSKLSLFFAHINEVPKKFCSSKLLTRTLTSGSTTGWPTTPQIFHIGQTSPLDKSGASAPCLQH